MSTTTRPSIAHASRPISRRWRRWPPSMPMTTRRRSSTRSRSTSRPRPTTRPTPTSSRARRSWSRSSSASRGIRASSHYLIHLYDYAGDRRKGPRTRPGDTPRSRRRRRMRSTCRRTSSRASATGRNSIASNTASVKAAKADKDLRAINCTARTTWSTPICSLARTTTRATVIDEMARSPRISTGGRRRSIRAGGEPGALRGRAR